MEDPLYAQAREKAFRFLALRPHSEWEIRRKLKEKGFAGDVIAQVMVRLEELRYIDDAAFARGWAKSRAGGRLWGDRRIAVGLKEKGVPPEVIREALAEIRQEMDEGEALRQLLFKKLRGRDLATLDIREKRRLAQMLATRGFPLGLIFREMKVGEGQRTED